MAKGPIVAPQRWLQRKPTPLTAWAQPSAGCFQQTLKKSYRLVQSLSSNLAVSGVLCLDKARSRCCSARHPSTLRAHRHGTFLTHGCIFSHKAPAYRALVPLRPPMQAPCGARTRLSMSGTISEAAAAARAARWPPAGRQTFP